MCQISWHVLVRVVWILLLWNVHSDASSLPILFSSPSCIIPSSRSSHCETLTIPHIPVAFATPFAFVRTLSVHAWTATAAQIAHCRGSLNLPGEFPLQLVNSFPSLDALPLPPFSAIPAPRPSQHSQPIHTHTPKRRFVYMANWSLRR